MNNNIFTQGVDELIEELFTQAKVTIKYWRGSLYRIIDKAWMGRTSFRVQEEERSKLEWDDRDYFIPVVELKLNNLLITPQEGDWIEQIIPAVKAPSTFKLFAPSGETIWRYSDPQEMIYRIHTKRHSFNSI